MSTASNLVAIACLLAGSGACGRNVDREVITHPARWQTTLVVDDAAKVIAAGSPCDPTTPPLSAGSAIPAPRLLAAWLGGADLSGAPTQPRPAVDEQLRAQGAQLFAAHCTACHGDKGGGDGPNATLLGAAPANFTTGVYEVRSTPPQSLPTDEDLFRTISRGLHGTAMIPWAAYLSEPERWALVEYLKTLAVDFSEDEAPAPEVTPRPPPVTPALVERGKGLFETSGCVSCHGADAKGDGPAATALRDAAGRPIAPRDLTGAHYHRGSELADIYLTLLTGFDGTPMASFAKVLSVENLWAITAYVHSLAPPRVPGPAGLTCLATSAPPDPEELAGVRIVVRASASGRP